jgi:hypothetical protein
MDQKLTDKVALVTAGLAQIFEEVGIFFRRSPGRPPAENRSKLRSAAAPLSAKRSRSGQRMASPTETL